MLDSLSRTFVFGGISGQLTPQQALVPAAPSAGAT